MRMKVQLLFAIVVALVFVFPQKVQAFSGAGAGTAGDPFQVTTCSQFTEIQSPAGSYATLMNDIDCTSLGNGIRIGGYFYPFTGNFNGNGHTITVAINTPSTEVGLFNVIRNATISNLRVAGSVSANGYTGGVIGRAADNSVITKVVNAASVTGTDSSYHFYFGGLVGEIFYYAAGTEVTITDSYNVGNIGLETRPYATYVSGGLVGKSEKVTIRRSYNRGKVVGGSGLVGTMNTGTVGTVSDSFNVGTIVGGMGLFGEVNNSAPYTHNGIITNNFFDASRSMVARCWNSYYAVLDQWPGECELINVGWSDNNHFKNNTTSRPFVDAGSVQVWDFTSVWETVPDGYPALRSIIADELSSPGDFAQPPPAPFDLFVPNRGIGTATITWKHTKDQYLPTSHFLFEYKKTTDNDWNIIDTSTLSFDNDNPRIELSGLEHTAFYNVRIKGVNSIGEGNYSAVFTFSSGTPAAKSSAPRSIAVTPQGDPLIVDVTWDIPESSGDYPLLAYLVEVKYNTSTWENTVITQRVVAPITDTTIAGLKNSYEYDFRILPVTAEGEGAASDVAQYATPLSTVHYIKNCTESTDEENFGLLGIDNDTAYRDDVFYLANNIDCEGVAYVPMHYTSGEWAFEGILDGQGFAIQNVTIPTMNYSGNGLFHSLHGATIRNFSLDMTMVDLVGTKINSGAIAGSSYGYTSIDNVDVAITAEISGGDYLAGLIGETYSSNDINSTISITNSSVVGSIINDEGDSSGGLVGMITCDDTSLDRYCSVIQNNTVNATIHASEWGGGMVGYYYITASKGILVTNNVFSGTIESDNPWWDGGSFGGIIGNLWIYTDISRNIISHNTTSGTIHVTEAGGGIIGNYGNYTDAAGMVFDNNHSSMTITGEYSLGGLIGYFENSNWEYLPVPELVSNSSFTGSVTGVSSEYGVGGLIGEMYAYNFFIQKSYSSAPVVGGEYVGGLIGYAEGNIIIDDSYSSGAVTGTYSSIGGMIGYAYGDDDIAPILIRNSYATGAVSGEDRVGGLIGELDWMVGIENSFFDGTVTSTASNPYQTGAIIGNTYDMVYSFEDVSYNAGKTNPFSCVGDPYEVSDFESCLGVNADNTIPDYFKGTLSNAPLSTWNTTIWKKVADDYPTLRWSVSDSTAPIITLKGSSSVSVIKGGVYVDAGATAVDDFDGDLTAQILVVNLVDTAQTGVYHVRYTVCDEEGNCAAEVTRRVDVVAQPLATLSIVPTTSPAPILVPRTWRVSDDVGYPLGKDVYVLANKADSIVIEVDSVDYVFEVTEVGDNYVTITDIHGAKMFVEIGEQKAIDCNGDGKTDVFATVTDIQGSARFGFRAVLGANETWPSVSASISPTVVEKRSGNLLWLWVFLIFVSGVGIWMYIRKKP